MRKRTVKLWRLHEDGRKLFAGTIEAADPRELVLKWSAFLATAEPGTYFATYRGSFVGPEPTLVKTPPTWLPNSVRPACWLDARPPVVLLSGAKRNACCAGVPTLSGAVLRPTTTDRRFTMPSAALRTCLRACAD